MTSKKSFKWRLAQWLEIRWWKNYLSGKQVDTYLKDKKAYWHSLVASLDIHFGTNDKILDAGCGPAGIFMIFNKQSVIAIDPLLDQYKLLPHFSPQSYSSVIFENCSIENYSPKDSFDWICCLNAINHVDDWEKGLDVLTELSQANGQLLLGIDVHRHQWLKWIFRNFPGDVLHPHQHDRTDYQQALQKRGWTIKKVYTWKQGTIFDYWLLVAEWVP